jgi:hypothetical protein
MEVVSSSEEATNQQLAERVKGWWTRNKPLLVRIFSTVEEGPAPGGGIPASELDRTPEEMDLLIAAARAVGTTHTDIDFRGPENI